MSRLSLYTTLWVLAVGAACDSAFDAKSQCSLPPPLTQNTVLLQTSQLGDRSVKENSTINDTLDKPHSERHGDKEGSASHLPSSDGVRRFFMKLIFGTATLTSDQKTKLIIFFSITGLLVVIVVGVAQFLSRRAQAIRAANEAAEQERLPRQMDPREWTQAVAAYRHAMTGKTSKTIIKGSKQPKPQESGVLKSAIAQAEMLDAAQGKKPPGGSEAEERAKRAKAAMARFESSQSSAQPPSAEEEEAEEAQPLGSMHSLDEVDGSFEGIDFVPDHSGPTACTYFSKPSDAHN